MGLSNPILFYKEINIMQKIYCKDELPTWKELHDTFINDYKVKFIKTKDSEIDKYWKLPKDLINLAFGCNQLNSMIVNNDTMDTIIKKIQSDYKELPIIQIYFTLTHPLDNQYFIYNNKLIDPPIYSIKIPSTNEFSIFINKGYEHSDVAELPEEVKLIFKIVLNESIPTDDLIISEDYMKDLILLILDPVIQYFNKQKEDGKQY